MIIRKHNQTINNQSAFMDNVRGGIAGAVRGTGVTSLTLQCPELAPLSALWHSTRQILISSTSTTKGPKLAPLSALGHSNNQIVTFIAVSQYPVTSTVKLCESKARWRMGHETHNVTKTDLSK